MVIPTMDQPLQGQIALVTGASRGIGRACALALAAQGATVVVNFATQAAAAAEVCAAIAAAGGQAVARQADVAEGAAVSALFDAIKADYGRLDILVNNAGITRDGLLLRMKDADWQRVLAVNLTGAFHCSKAAAQLMLRQKSGRIVNITSVVGETGNAGQANYAASKAGLIGLTRSVARELASRQITVNAIAPGYIITEMTDKLTPEQHHAILGQVPLGCLGQPEDVAALVVFLVTQGKYITGQVFNVDGGLVMA